jgi:hypothetical protein
MSFERAHRRALASAAVLVAAVFVASPSLAASPENRAAARQHLGQAEALKKKGQLAEACKHLEEVERLDPKLPTLMDLAACTEQSGNLVAAETWWALARDRAKKDEKPQSRARAESRLAVVQKKVAHLTLQLAPGAPADVQVLRDDVPLEPASLGTALATNPGAHVIVVKLAGREDATYAVKLADGENQTLPIAPGSVKSAAAPAAAAAPVAALPPPPPPPSAPAAPVAVEAPKPEPAAAGWWTGQRTVGVIAGVAGLAGVGVGAALIATNSDASSTDRGKTLGGVALAGGGVLFVSGIVLLVSGSSDDAQHASMTLTPTLLVAREATVLGAVGKF